jgi:hypothetical protein
MNCEAFLQNEYNVRLFHSAMSELKTDDADIAWTHACKKEACIAKGYMERLLMWEKDDPDFPANYTMWERIYNHYTRALQAKPWTTR